MCTYGRKGGSKGLDVYPRPQGKIQEFSLPPPPPPAGWVLDEEWLGQEGVTFFFVYIRPALSSRKALGLTARSRHQCCRAHCSHAVTRMPRGENMDLCPQITLVRGSAVGTAMPKQPKIN